MARSSVDAEEADGDLEVHTVPITASPPSLGPVLREVESVGDDAGCPTDPDWKKGLELAVSQQRQIQGAA